MSIRNFPIILNIHFIIVVLEVQSPHYHILFLEAKPGTWKIDKILYISEY